MLLLKKLSLAPIFLISFGFLLYSLNPLFASYDILFSLSLTTFLQLIILASVIILSGFSFILFSSLAQDFKFVLPIAVVAGLMPFIFVNIPLSIILAIGTLISLLFSYLTLEGKLKSYLNFEPNSLLGPSIRHLSGFLVIVISLTFFLSINKIIQEKGFQIPDSLIDTVLKVSGQSQSETTQTQVTQSSLTKEQIDLLKKNPDLLKQNGLDPKILEKPTQSDQNLIKQTLKDQLQNLLKPYLGILPLVLGFLLFISLQSLVTFLGILIYPLLWIIFSIFEKTKFITFTEEQRTVKKMVI